MDFEWFATAPDPFKSPDIFEILDQIWMNTWPTLIQRNQIMYKCTYLLYFWFSWRGISRNIQSMAFDEMLISYS
jgi:hypothetical protein